MQRKECSRWRKAIRASVSDEVAADESARIQSHLAACPDCQHYAAQLRAATGGLRWLGTRPVEPSPGFRARWIRAVEEAARPGDARQAGAVLLAWWRGLLVRNLRPALGIASLWVLALFFRLSAPGVSLSAQTPVARSPIEIYRALETQEQLLTARLGRERPTPATRRGRHEAQPRSEGLPSRPTAHSDYEPGVWTI